jgi:hypothetical protein
MKSGIYSASLTSEDEPIAEAILVVSGRTVNGASRGYLARGYYDQESDTVSCELLLYRKDEAVIFGREDRYTLQLRRDTQQPAKLVFLGHTDQDPERKLSVEFIWQGSLAE